ncbi:MAG: GNAT family N-acetyltransferase [Chloroflexi bacterium]|nr:GNAT family N-acetyltransferase [Chloroflexota bacterium]
MKTKIERDYEREQRRLREMYEKYQQLPLYHKFKFMLFIYWLIFKSRVKSLPLYWIKFVTDMERQFELHGMPFALKLKLEKWFNYPTHSDKKFFTCQDKKIWYHCWNEKDNFELHLHYRAGHPGHIWFAINEDGTATIIGIHVKEEYRNKGLGTMAFQEAISQIKDKASSLKGTLERQDFPEPDASFRWLRRQGFEIKEKENGDYEIELRIN